MDQPILVDDQGRQYIAYEYSLVADFGQLAASAQQVATPRIDNSSEFVLTKISGYCDASGTPTTNPLLEVTIQDGGSDRPLQNAPTPWVATVGTAELPYILSIPLVMVPTSNLNVTVRNFSASTTYDNIKIVFKGYRRVYQTRQV